MIINKTPLKISLIGGGTDLPVYFREFEGTTIGLSIDKYLYVFLRKANIISDYNYRVLYSQEEISNNIKSIKHPVVREVLKFYQEKSPLEIIYTADLPSKIGLGSSSAFTVGMCKSILEYRKIKKKKLNIAYDAIEIEQNKIGEVVGSQDQVLCSFGGLNKIKFKKNNEIVVSPINIGDKNKKILTESMLLLYTNRRRIAENVEKNKIKNIKENQQLINNLHEIKKLANQMKLLLEKKNLDLKTIGSLISYSWEEKKKLSKLITNDEINDIFQLSIKYGVYGGKLLGAGGGGFFLLICDPTRKEDLKKKFKNYKILDVSIDNYGSRIIKNCD